MHAQVYWNLINNVKRQDWDHRYGFFTFQIDIFSIDLVSSGSVDGDKFPMEAEKL